MSAAFPVCVVEGEEAETTQPQTTQSRPGAPRTTLSFSLKRITPVAQWRWKVEDVSGRRRRRRRASGGVGVGYAR